MTSHGFDNLIIARNCTFMIVALFVMSGLVSNCVAQYNAKRGLPHCAVLLPIHVSMLVVELMCAITNIILTNISIEYGPRYATEYLSMIFVVVPITIVATKTMPRTIIKVILQIMYGTIFVTLLIGFPLLFDVNSKQRSYAVITVGCVVICVLIGLMFLPYARVKNNTFRLHIMFVGLYILFIIIRNAYILQVPNSGSMSGSTYMLSFIIVRTYIWSLAAITGILILFRDNQYWIDLYTQKEQFDTIFMELSAYDSHVSELIGSNIFIEYPLLKFINRCGIGSYSVVYRGMYNRKIVALKVYTPSEITNKVVYRWARETSISMLLSHPNIVRCYGICIVPPKMIVIMEYCKHTLLTHLRKRVLTYRHKLLFMIDVARAILFLHDHGIIHRDIKSTNIMVRDGLAKLIDFSESRHRDLTSMTVVGTPQYIAPEMLTGGPFAQYSYKIDIFSMGILFWEILHDGSPIYPAQYNIAQILRSLNSGYRPEIDKRIDDTMKYLITRMWSSNPIERPTARGLLDELEEYLPTQGVVCTPTRLATKTSPLNCCDA